MQGAAGFYLVSAGVGSEDRPYQALRILSVFPAGKLWPPFAQGGAFVLFLCPGFGQAEQGGAVLEYPAVYEAFHKAVPVLWAGYGEVCHGAAV